MTPAAKGSPPASRMPWTRAFSIQGPDSRVSRPMRIRGERFFLPRSSTSAPPKKQMEE
jgi:hypothetical protein